MVAFKRSRHPGGRKAYFHHAVSVMKTLANNTDLYNYLRSLEDLLADRGAEQLADSIRFAAGQSTELSTEFLGESRIALRQVL